MTDKKDAAAGVREDFLARKLTSDLIADGRLPTVDELLVGHGFAKGSLETDAHIWATDVIRRADEYDDEVVDVARVIADVGYNTDMARALLYVLETHQETDEATRMIVYVACSENDVELRARLATIIGTRLRVHDMRHDFTGVHYGFVQVGLMTGFYRSMDDYLAAGVGRLEILTTTWSSFVAARDDDFTHDVDADIFDLLAAVSEDRAEIDTRPQKKARQGPAKKPTGVIVVPNLGSAVTDSRSTRHEAAKLWRELHGQTLPLAMRGDVIEQRNRLADRHPHAVDAINAVFADIGTSEHVSFRPTLLVGRTGSGKSELMTAIANALGVPSEPVSLAGSADGSVMGTSAQWSTSGESVPLQAIRKNKIANPIVAWDEIDKAVSSHNGYALDAMLPMLEYSTAKAIRDPALEVAVDISWVSHIATANELHKIPKTLLNRFRVIEIPWPKREHIAGISRGLIEQIADRRRQDRRFFPLLTPEEIEMVARYWRGGSIRNLVPVVEAVIDSREIEMGHA